MYMQKSKAYVPRKMWFTLSFTFTNLFPRIYEGGLGEKKKTEKGYPNPRLSFILINIC